MAFIISYDNRGVQSTRDRRASMSNHADKRAQLRGIDKAALPLLLAYGHREFGGRGGIRYLMTAESLEALSRAVGSTKVEALAGVYAVVSAVDQTVITMGHRHN